MKAEMKEFIEYLPPGQYVYGTELYYIITY